MSPPRASSRSRSPRLATYELESAEDSVSEGQVEEPVLTESAGHAEEPHHDLTPQELVQRVDHLPLVKKLELCWFLLTHCLSQARQNE